MTISRSHPSASKKLNLADSGTSASPQSYSRFAHLSFLVDGRNSAKMSGDGSLGDGVSHIFRRSHTKTSTLRLDGRPSVTYLGALTLKLV